MNPLAANTGDSLAAQDPQSKRVVYGPGTSRLGFPRPVPPSWRKKKPKRPAKLDPASAGTEFEPAS